MLPLELRGEGAGDAKRDLMMRIIVYVAAEIMETRMGMLSKRLNMLHCRVLEPTQGSQLPQEDQ
ncbi:hypothetical protein EYF80_004709 [Liparis tanakae]|uniref:Uncharacterized protein n=1 Tax=Liparis tanakae TaxID=230148 RepID=A0A4Z2J3Y8_9TELE|nr:hypothetical protein EYF80_004709 [Liparis tanakae]